MQFPAGLTVAHLAARQVKHAHNRPNFHQCVGQKGASNITPDVLGAAGLVCMMTQSHHPWTMLH